MFPTPAMQHLLLLVAIAHRILVLQVNLRMPQLVRHATQLWAVATEPTSPARAKF